MPNKAVYIATALSLLIAPVAAMAESATGSGAGSSSAASGTKGGNASAGTTGGGSPGSAADNGSASGNASSGTTGAGSVAGNAAPGGGGLKSGPTDANSPGGSANTDTLPATGATVPGGTAAARTPAPAHATMAQSVTGIRASKLIGQSVYNSANDTVGSIDDIIVSRSDHVVYAILSVGGFLGIGDRLVAVRYSDLRMEKDGKVVLSSATRNELKSLPEFTYRG